MPNSVSGLIHRVETFFDRLKLGYKWRYDRWKHLRIVLYRGYGTQERIYFRGRVLDDKDVDIEDEPQNAWQNILNTWRRIETDEIPGARVAVHVGGRRLDLVTDEDGFFEADVEVAELPQADGPWHRIRAELLKPESDEPVVEEGHVLIPRNDAEFAVVSDIDDTVVKTGAADSLRMARTVVLNNATTRVPFPGVSGFYKALEEGPDRRGHNPTFYVSSSPWNFYGMFEAFKRVHDIPLGPLFLKDYGFSEDKFFKSGHGSHKMGHIRKLLEIYPDLPFVLIGDSGQEDPEIYREIVRSHPGRIRAVYVRDVTTPRRDREVRSIAREVEELGAEMILVQDSIEAGEHAAEVGLIHPDAIDEIREAKQEDESQGRGPNMLDRLLGLPGEGRAAEQRRG